MLVLGCLEKFFEGLYPLFWLEVLSIMGMVPIGTPSLRRLISWVRVSGFQFSASLDSNMTLIGCRMWIQHFLREFRIFVILSLHSTPPSPLALHTSIFPHDHFCPHNHLYQEPSARKLLGTSSYEQGTCCHGQHCHWNGQDTRDLSLV